MIIYSVDHRICEQWTPRLILSLMFLLPFRMLSLRYFFQSNNLYMLTKVTTWNISACMAGSLLWATKITKIPVGRSKEQNIKSIWLKRFTSFKQKPKVLIFKLIHLMNPFDIHKESTLSRTIFQQKFDQSINFSR